MQNGLPHLVVSPAFPHRVQFFKNGRLHHAVMAFNEKERDYFHATGTRQGFVTANEPQEKPHE